MNRFFRTPIIVLSLTLASLTNAQYAIDLGPGAALGVAGETFVGDVNGTAATASMVVPSLTPFVISNSAFSRLEAASADLFVGHAATAASGYRPVAYAYDRASKTDVFLSAPANSTSFASAVAGSTIGGNIGGLPVIWLNTNTAPIYLPRSQGAQGFVADLSNSGQAVGLEGTGSGSFQAVVWQTSRPGRYSVKKLHPAGSISSEAVGINNAGTFGAGYVSTNFGSSDAVLWDLVSLRAIRLPHGGSRAAASDCSSRITVGNVDGQAVYWENASRRVVDIHKFLPSNFTYSYALRIEEQLNLVVGYAVDVNLQQHAIVWRL